MVMVLTHSPGGSRRQYRFSFLKGKTCRQNILNLQKFPMSAGNGKTMRTCADYFAWLVKGESYATLSVKALPQGQSSSVTLTEITPE
jgi:hypothetical protein